MDGAQEESIAQTGFSTVAYKRNPGDVIKSKDWNGLVDEIGSLGERKVDLSGAQTIKGRISIESPSSMEKPADPDLLLEVKGKVSFLGSLVVGTDTGRPEGEGGDSAASAFIAGKVGIGTRNPSANLDVQGVIRASGSADQIQIQSYDQSEKTWRLGTHIGSAGANRNFSIWESDLGNALTISQKDGKVGIGTTEPESSLAIQKDAPGALGAELALVNKGGGPGASVAIDFGVDNSTYTGEMQNAQIKVTNLTGDPENASKMTFSTWDGSKLREGLTLMPDGKVGIGTTKPENRLAVRMDAAGALGADLALVNKGGGAGTSVATYFCLGDSHAGEAGNAQIKVTSLSNENDTSKMTFSTWDGSALRERLAILSDGRIGIGTSEPETTLHVQGDITCKGRVADEKVRAFTHGKSPTGISSYHISSESHDLLLFTELAFESRKTVIRFDFTAADVCMEGIDIGVARFDLFLEGGECLDEIWEGFNATTPLHHRRLSLTRIFPVVAGRHVVKVAWGIRKPVQSQITGTPKLTVWGAYQLSAIEL